MIRQPYPVAIALRYLRARTQNAFISFISLVSMFGIALSIAVLIIVMAVINGFESELEHRILSVMPDASLYGYSVSGKQPLDDWRSLQALALEREDVIAATPFVEGGGLAIAGGRLLQIAVRGIDPLSEGAVSSIADQFRSGSIESLDGDWSIALGSQLAESLGVVVGDQLNLRTPEFRITPAGLYNTNATFTVTGIFDVGMAEFDRGLALIHIDDAMRLYRTRNRASGISLKVNDVYAAGDIVNAYGHAVANRYGGTYLPDDWRYRYRNIFSSISLTKPLLFIVLSMVLAIAAFNIVSTLFMVVREKRGDIAILRSIGSAPRHILQIFVVQGAAIGVIGMLGGLLLGLALVVSLGTIVGWVESVFAIDLLSADVYPFGDLPTEARFGEIARICGLAFLLAVLATLYPAYRAARLPPADALRNE